MAGLVLAFVWGPYLHGSDAKPRSGPPNPGLIKANQSPAFSSPAGLVEMRRTFTLDARTACPAQAPRLIDI